MIRALNKPKHIAKSEPQKIGNLNLTIIFNARIHTYDEQ